MIGHLLTWLQEHTSSILTIATCNDHTKLPPELSRAGRFDDLWFIDLPSRQERSEIAQVHLARFGCDVNGFPDAIAQLCDGWTGAEIEQLVKSAARRTGRMITHDAITQASQEIKPISKVRSAEIKALREWAKTALRFANTPDVTPVLTGRRIAQHG